MKIRALIENDWPEVERIYMEGIATKLATFETESPGWTKWDSVHLPSCRFIAEIDNMIAGWVALSPVSDRCVYGGVAEISVYIGHDYRGKGVGRALMEKVIKASEDIGIWTLMAATFPENTASVQLHLKSGFRKIGIREKIGKLDGVWRDTVLMERRSDKVY